MTTLKNRIDNYKSIHDYKLMPKVPIILTINGRNFFKLTSSLEKPFSEAFAQCLYSTLLKLCSEIDGSVFGYSFNDELIIVLRNDQTISTLPYYDNNVQQIISTASSIATYHFNNCANSLDLNLLGEAIFSSTIFTVPNLTEAANTIICKQQEALQISINQACFYELEKSHEKEHIKKMLFNLSNDDKVNLLQQECNTDYSNYPSPFRRGISCYKAPKIIEDKIKSKFSLNLEIPIYSDEYELLFNILKNGSDILRQK